MRFDSRRGWINPPVLGTWPDEAIIQRVYIGDTFWEHAVVPEADFKTQLRMFRELKTAALAVNKDKK